ncbi:XRE family transcriptional regulator [Flagellimonas flava]|uniref:XRE family transcriptional regulator n=1 Tax=Flagellimonas flava TaxID=570519 RepID=UPI003D653C71
MLNDINPRMLVLARESRGLSQSELSKRLNISQGKLSKAEKGEQSINDSILVELANQLNYPELFFYQQTPSSPVSHYYYRKRITISKKVMAKMESTIKVFRNNIDSLMDSVELPDFNIPTFDPSDDFPEEIARKARYLLKIPNGPIGNLTNILERNGILIVKTDLFNEKTDGLSTISDRGAHIIFLNERMPNDRQRYSLAHELGHMIMHFDIPSDSEKVEEEADRFASEFLMPESEIKNSLRNLNFNKLGDLKRYWKVSMRSLVRRAKDLGMLTSQEYRNFQINFSRRGMSKSEPIPLPEEKPYLLNQIVKLHLTELEYSEDELARIVNLNLTEFRDRFIEKEIPKLKILRDF